MKIVLRLAAVTLILVVLVMGCGSRPEASPPVAREPAVTAEEQGLLDKVEVSSAVQSQLDGSGRQKLGITVFNHTDRVLVEAELRVTTVTWDGMSGNMRLFQKTSQETFTLPPVSPGGWTAGSMWFYPQPDSEVTYIWLNAEFQ